MNWLYTAAGILIIAVGLLDVFQTLLHPTGRGRLSRLLFVGIWGLSKRTGHKAGTFTGPVAVLSSILLWAVLQVVGWALIYYPHIPQGFFYSPGINEAQYGDFAEALYTSIVTLATLGYGNVVAADNWLRLFSPLQAVTGFALLTAAVSWFLQIYPALARRRALAVRLTLLKKVDYAQRLAVLDSSVGAQLLESLADELVRVRVDLTQNSETYFFREADPEASLPASISYAFELCAQSKRSQRPDVRLAGTMVEVALKDLASLLKSQFPSRGNTTAEVFAYLATDHGYPSSSPDHDCEAGS